MKSMRFGIAALAAAVIVVWAWDVRAQEPKPEEPAAKAAEPAPKVEKPALEAKNKKEQALMDAARKVADAVSKNDFELFEKKLMVDRKRYSHFYEKVHSIEIAERGWREFVDGLKENFGKKLEKMKEPQLTFQKLEFGKQGDFHTCELWAEFPAKGVATQEEGVREQLILHFIKIRGKWVVVSVE